MTPHGPPPGSSRPPPPDAPNPAPGLLLEPAARAALWKRVAEIIETFTERVNELPANPALDPEGIETLLQRADFGRPMEPREALELVAHGLTFHQVHTLNRRNFGLFNPAPTTMGIAADALVAAFNPQLAVFSQSPFAIEIERHLLRVFGERFGYAPTLTDGTFTSGGAEANHTALLTALIHAQPVFAAGGARALPLPPTLYISAEGHHSFLKAARQSGLGTDAVRTIEVDEDLRMRPEALKARLAIDRREGLLPFLIVATAGTTNAGAVDPLPAIAEIAAEERLWLHVDAAWGGAAALVPELSGLLSGIERADSITFDAHKWLSVPMGAGMYITRHLDILDRTFRVATTYMPRGAAGERAVDPYSHSMQWSRRFIGLKVFLSLAVAGFSGYAAALRHQTKMGERLRGALGESGWEVLNTTPLPVVCFCDRTRPDGRTGPFLEAMAREVVASRRAWISLSRLGGVTPALRACITHYGTEPEDVRALVELLNSLREQIAPS